jgi:hypothetical protein
MFRRREAAMLGLIALVEALMAAIGAGATVNAALTNLRAPGDGARYAELLRRHIDVARMVLPTTQVDRRQSWQPCAARRLAAPCEEEFSQLAVALEAGAARPMQLWSALDQLTRQWRAVRA